MDNNTLLVKDILKTVHDDMTDEEIVRLILKSKVSTKPVGKATTFGARASDALASFAGSWAFVIGFVVMLLVWIAVNSYFLTSKQAFDPYPFILLNLVLSCIAAIQAPVIIMSQNRQEQKDRERSENDYKVNLKTEIIIEDTHKKLNIILHKLDHLTQQQKKLLGKKVASNGPDYAVRQPNSTNDSEIKNIPIANNKEII